MNHPKEGKIGGKEMLYGTTLSAESIKVMAESVGISALSDDAAKELAEDVSLKIKKIVQDAVKFMRHGKRDRLTTEDIDAALRVRGIEPQYGFHNKEFVPFRFASGGGRELHFQEDPEIDLQELISNAATCTNKIPLDISIRSHWLAVDGIQPLIPENPPPLSKDAQALESVNPVISLEQGITKETAGKPTIGKIHKLRNLETVHVKQLATHELSVEQQLYYKAITEACVGSDESRRGEALQSLSSDPGLHEMLPRMCTFIAEGVKVNVVQNNLALLIYLMRMVKALLDNTALYLEKYLHEFVPSVITCIVSRQLCMRPELDNHWALRDFAARLMAQICKNFNTPTNNLQTRVTRIFSKALQNDKTHLSTLYGSLAGLSELGGEVVKVLIIPRLRFISERIEAHLLGTSQSNTDKTAAGYIRAMVQKNCPPILRQIRNPPDLMDDYKNDYGFLGPSLCQAVVKLRNQPSSLLIPSTTTPITSTSITSAAQSATGRPQMTHTVRQSAPMAITIQTPRNVTPTIQPQAQLNKPQRISQVAQQQQHTTQSPSATGQVGSPMEIILMKSGSIQPNRSPSPIQIRQTESPPALYMPSRFNNPQQQGRSISPTEMRQTGSPFSPVVQTTDSQMSRQLISPEARETPSPIDAQKQGHMNWQQGGIRKESITNWNEQRGPTTLGGTEIINTEEVPPPPELDDLSHLQ